MGALKHILEESIKNAHRITGKSHARTTFESYQESFDRLRGEMAIWTTNNNPNIKKPQLVQIERTYPYYVILSKRTFNLEGDESCIRYAVNYASIIAGCDAIEMLE